METESVLERIKKRRKEELEQLNIENEKITKEINRKIFIDVSNLFIMFFIIGFCMILYIYLGDWLIKLLLGE